MRVRLGLVFFIGVAIALCVLASRGGSADALAQKISTACRNAADAAKCYEQEVPTLYPRHAVSEVFDVVREIRHNDPSYQFCHVLAHRLGERVVAEDPDHWIDAIPLNPPDGLCSNGFIHGVVGGRFRAEVLDDETVRAFIPDFARACEARDSWRPSDLDRAICYHGMGHLYTFITDADIPKALDICDKTTPGDMHRVCIEGVFMQIYQPLEPDDFLMLERMDDRPSTTTVRRYCAHFDDDRYEGACLRESWPYFKDEILSGEGAERFCSGQPSFEETRACFDSISSIVGRMSLNEPNNAVRACGKFPSSFKETCFAATAQAVLEENRSDSEAAIGICKSAGAQERPCVEALLLRAGFVFGSDTKRYTDFCRRLPDDLRSQCLNTAQ